MKTIADVLRFYREEVSLAVATAQTLENAFPREILNEIRSTFTHIARSDDPELSLDDQNKELVRAQAHLERVCLDCHKVSILNRAEAADLYVGTIEEDGAALPADIYRGLSDLRKRREMCGVKEGRQPPNGTVEELRILLDDYDRFVLRLQVEFGGELAERRRAIKLQKEDRDRRERRKENWRNIMIGAAIGFVFGVAASLLATFLWERYVRDVAIPPVGTNPPAASK